MKLKLLLVIVILLGCRKKEIPPEEPKPTPVYKYSFRVISKSPGGYSILDSIKETIIYNDKVVFVAKRTCYQDEVKEIVLPDSVETGKKVTLIQDYNTSKSGMTARVFYIYGAYCNNQKIKDTTYVISSLTYSNRVGRGSATWTFDIP
jgi:hypothetical protein